MKRHMSHFRGRMVAVASGIMGSEWAALTWEHAYYIQYHNQKAAFFQAVWNLWNWKDIAAR